MNTLKLPEKTEYLLRLVKNLSIPSTPGQATFLDYRDRFKKYFDSNIKNWNLTVAGPAQGARTASVYAITKAGPLATIVRSLGVNETQLMWQNQEQIMAFMTHHTEKLQPNRWANFFPYWDGRPFNFRIDHEPAHNQMPAGFNVFLYPFYDDAERSVALEPYLVVPEMAAA